MTSLSRFLFRFLVLATLLLVGAAANAQFYDATAVGHTFPTQMTAGERYSVTVTMRNSGNVSWTGFDGVSLAPSPDIWGMPGAALSSPVAAGATTTFTFQVIAPAAGTYSAQWMMSQNGDYFGSPATINVVVVPPAVALVSGATVVAQSVPANMVAGERYPVSVTLRNSGTSTWDPALQYLLGSQNPENNFNWGQARIALDRSVGPGDTITLNFMATAPATPGDYRFQWRMVHEFVEWFGDFSPNALVHVDPQPVTSPAPTLTVSPEAISLAIGQDYVPTITSGYATLVTYSCATPGGLNRSGSAPLNGSLNFGATQASWAGTTSFCYWTASGPGGADAHFTTVMTTRQPPPPVPTLQVSPPSTTLSVGSNYAVMVTSANATSVVYNCTTPGGLISSGAAPLNGPLSLGVTQANWNNVTSACTWTASGPGGNYSTTTTMKTEAAPLPVPTLQVSPTAISLAIGQDYIVTISSSDASTVAYTCATPGGLNRSGSVAVNGSFNFGATQASWAGVTSACTWTASGPGGTAPVATSMTTVAPPPVANTPPTVSITPYQAVIIAGENYVVSTATTDATSLTYDCSRYGGFLPSGAAPVNGTVNFGATPTTSIGTSSICIWTASGPGGSTNFTTIMTTSVKLPTVSMSLPTDPSVAFASGTTPNVRIRAVGTSYGGQSVARLLLYDGDAFLYTFPGDSVDQFVYIPVGFHQLKLRAVDSLGQVGTAYASSTLTVQQASMPIMTVDPLIAEFGAGKPYAITYAGIGAEFVDYSCVSSGGMVAISSNMPPTGVLSGTALEAWIGHDSVCTWTARNIAFSAPQLVTTFKVTAKPTATLTSPADNLTVYAFGTTPNVRIIGSGTASAGRTVEHLELYDNGVLADTYTGGAVDRPYLVKGGTHVLTLYAIDSAGVKGDVDYGKRTVTSLVPTLTVTPTETQAEANGHFTFDWTSTYLDAIDVICTNQGSTEQEHLSAAPVVAGQLTIRAHADWLTLPTSCKWTGSNSSGSMSVNITLTTVASSTPTPVSVLTSPANFTSLTLAAPNGIALLPVRASATTAGTSPIAHIDFYDGGQLLLSVPGSTIDAAVPISTGLHLLRVRGVDAAGKEGVFSQNANVFISAGTNNAVSSGKNVLTQVAPGTAFSATVTMTNTGNTTWLAGAGYALVAAPAGGTAWTSSNRIALTSSVDPRGATTFTINAQAPTQPGTYHFRWQMAQADAAFGTLSDDVTITVASAGAGASPPTLTASPMNSRVEPGGYQAVSLHGSSGIEPGTLVRLELLDQGGSVIATVTPPSGAAAPQTLDQAMSLESGVYSYVLRTFWSTGVTRTTAPLYINVTDSALMGLISGVRTGADGVPRLLGWTCLYGNPNGVTYELFVNAPPTVGSVAILAGVATVSGEVGDTGIQNHCGTSGFSHHFNIDLNAASARVSGGIPGGTPLYVRASINLAANTNPPPSPPDNGTSIGNDATKSRGAEVARSSATTMATGGPNPFPPDDDPTEYYDSILPCENNNCTMPGSLRISLASPTNAKPYKAGGTMAMQATVAGTTSAIDGVDFSFDGGTWAQAGPDDGAYRYILQQGGLVSDPSAHTVQARVRQGTVTVYTDITTFTVIAYKPPTLTASSPASGASFAANTDITLSVNPKDKLGDIQAVKFLVNDVAVGSAIKGGDTWTLVWRPTVGGTAVIKAVAYDDTSTALVTWTLGTITITGSSNSSDTPLPVVVAIPQLGGADAGSLPGNLTVGDDGASNYSIPLAMPPGTAGMVPSLSLNYSSTNTTGSAGLGWSLGGLSNIDRCGKTVATDGVADAVRFVNRDGELVDRLCLDGQRLVLVNGDTSNAAYWQANAEYRTEVESFTRVRTLIVAGIRTFKVETKDKQIAFYGDTSDSVVGPSGMTHRWRLSRRTDRSGNYISYEYTPFDSGTGESKPLAIRWGGNCALSAGAVTNGAFLCAGGTSHYAKVTFGNEARAADPRTAYIAGVRADERTRLSTIATFTDTAANGDGGTAVSTYRLTYETSAISRRSLLAAIKLCEGDSSTRCMQPTTFTWGKAVDGQKRFDSLGGQRVGPDLDALSINKYNVNVNDTYVYQKTANDMIASGDFNGDGKTDILERYRLPANGFQQRLYTSNSTGTGWDASTPFDGIGGSLAVMEVGDFDGDGLLDVLVSDYANGTYPSASNDWRLCLGRNRVGGKFVCDVPVSFPIDAFPPSTELSPARLVRDFNGDGKDDLYFTSRVIIPEQGIKTGKQFMCLSMTNAFNCTDVTDTRSEVLQQDVINGSTVVSTQYADVDGDGRVDRIRLSKCYLRYRPNSNSNIKEWFCGSPGHGVDGGISAFSETEPGTVGVYGTMFPFPTTRTIVLPPPMSSTLSWDANADGYSDVVFGSAQTDSSEHLSALVGNICYSKGNGAGDCRQLPASNFSTPGLDHLVLTIGDFDGDGIMDVLRPGVDTLGIDNFNTYQLCHIAPDASAQVCEAWSGPTFYSMARNNFLSPAEDGFVDKTRSTFMGDFNGDGKPDIATYLGGVLWEISGAADQAAPGQAIDKLLTVTNGVGSVDQVEYAAVNDTAVYSPGALAPMGGAWPKAGKLAYPGRQLVKTLRRGNGPGRTLDTRYTYAGYAIDPTGRGNLGFARVDVTDGQTNIVSSTWRSQSYPSIGMPLKARTVTAGGVVLSDTNTSYAQAYVAHAGGATTTYAYPSEATILRRDLVDVALDTTVSKPNVAPDAWGNFTDTQVVTTGGAPAKTFTVRTLKLFDNVEASWRLGEVRALTERRIVDGSTIDHNTAYIYTAEGLVATEDRMDTVLALRLTTTYERSGQGARFGLVNKVKLNWRDPVTNSDQTRTVATTEYETNGRFPVNVTNALGHVELKEFDHRFGTPSKVTTANGLVATRETNLIGQRKETATDGTETITNVKTCTPGPCPADAATVTIRQFKRGDVQVAVPTLVYNDSAGHALRSVTWGFDGQQIATDVRYDDRGRVHETGQPRFATDADSAGTTAGLTGTALAVRTEYDNLNRVVSTSSYDDLGTLRTNTTSYNGYTMTSTNPLGWTKTDIRDAWGRLEKTFDAANKLTMFEHDAFNNLTKTTDPLANEIIVRYDGLGRRTELLDPDLGHIVYSVDPLGQVYKQVSPVQALAGQATTMRYDDLGRMTARVDISLTAGWTYDKLNASDDCKATRSCGKLVESFTTLASGARDFTQRHTYNALGLPNDVKTTLDTVYTSSFVYDGWNRLSSEKHQRGAGALKEFARRYNAFGALARIEREGMVLWQASAVDASSRLTAAALGNSLMVKRDYNGYTGRLYNGSLKAGDIERMQEGYTFDVLGNVSNRHQSWSTGVAVTAGGFDEMFQYDEMNRLKHAEVVAGGATAEDFRYNEIGNILTKTGTGTYDYAPSGAGSVRPHAVRSIPGISAFGYDDNGNLLNGAGRVLTWNAFDMPITITKGAESSTFTYGADHQRTIQTKADGTKIYYAGAMEMDVQGGTMVQGKTYWPMGLGVEIEKGSSTTLNWTHVDRIGSVVAISNATGALIEAMNYDSWGKRRMGDALTKPDSVDGKTDNKGFTGHEMLDQLDLVHMNGRVYDPFVARFMSADPYIQSPSDSQSYNRYSYVWNNPTNLTDPTGFVAEGFGGSSYSFSMERGGGEGQTSVENAPTRTADRSGTAMDSTVTITASRAFSNFLRWLDQQILTDLARERAAQIAQNATRKAGQDFAAQRLVAFARIGLGFLPARRYVALGQVGLAIAAAQNSADEAAKDADSLSNGTKSAADKKTTDAAVDQLTDGVPSETDKRGRPVKGHHVNGTGDAQKDLESLPGEMGSSGQKTLPDGSTAGVHTSSTTGAQTLHIHRPPGSQDIKIRYPGGNQ